MPVLKLWSDEAEEAAEYIARHCIEQRKDGSYLFHHAKAVAVIDKFIKITKEKTNESVGNNENSSKSGNVCP